MIFRLSQKLNAKIKAGTLGTASLDPNPFADWSAHLFVASRTHYLLVSNTKSLYSTVLYSKGIMNDGQFIDRALSGIRESLEDDGLEFIYRRFVVPATGEVRFAKALDRSVTGSMNDLIRHAAYFLAAEDLSPFDVGPRLNDIPMSALGGSDSSYGIPKSAFRALAGDTEP